MVVVSSVLQGRQTKDGRWKTRRGTVQRRRQKETEIQKPFQKKTKNKGRKDRSVVRKLASILAFIMKFKKCIISRIHISSDQKKKTNITPLKDYVHVHYNDYKIKIKNNLTYGYLWLDPNY